MASFDGNVDFAQARQQATARKARYDPAKETLFLTGEARVVDEEQGSDLRAEAIEEVLERVADVADLERHALGEVVAASAREVVDRKDLVAAPDERLDEVRADEPCAAGHEVERLAHDAYDTRTTA